MKKFLLIILARCKVNFCEGSCSPAAARPLPNPLPQAGEGKRTRNIPSLTLSQAEEGKKTAFLVHLIPSPACGRGQAALAARERAPRSVTTPNHLLYSILCIFSAVLIASSAFAADTVDARLSKSTITENNVVQLILTWNANQEAQGNPDLKPLEQDFYIYGVGKGSEIQIVNGKASAQTQWTLTLLPKNTGILAIPALTIGNEKTKPLMLQVNKRGSPASPDTATPAAFIEISLSPEALYIDMPIVYRVKIFYEGDLVRGELSNPETDNVVVTRLGEDKNGEITRAGKIYHTIERNYVLLPKISGDLTPRPPIFVGEIAVSPNGKAIANGGFIETIPVQAIASAIHLHVNPKPPQANEHWWLPGSNVTLKEQWSADPPVFQVGEAITRTLSIEADNLFAEQLPALKVEAVADMNTYPDKPVLENKLSEKGLVGLRQEKIAYIPTKTGKITLPAITLDWFDIHSQTMKSVQVPAHIINVLPANNAEDTINAENYEQKTKEVNDINSASSGKASISAGTIVFALLWLTTLSLWWFSSKHKKNLKKKPVSKGSSLPELYK